MVQPGKQTDESTEQVADINDLFAAENPETDTATKEGEQEEGSQESEEQQISINDIFSEKPEESTEEETDEEQPSSTGKGEEEETGESPGSGEKETTQEKQSDDDSFTLTFARYQLEQGNLTAFDNEEQFAELEKIAKEQGEEAALSYLQNQESEAIRNQIVESYDEDVKYYLDLVDYGVDKDTAKNITNAKTHYDKVKVEDIESEEKEDLRRDILTQHYKLTTRFSDDKIKREIDKKINIGDDIDEAKEALPEIQNYFKETAEQEKEKKKKEEEDAAKQRKESLEKLEKTVDETDEIIPKQKLTPKQKEAIKKNLTQPAKEYNGMQLNAVWAKRMEDPINFDIQLAALLEYGVFDGKWDKVVTGTKSKATEDIKKQIKSNTSFKTKSGNKAFSDPSSNEEDAAKDAIDKMKGVFG